MRGVLNVYEVYRFAERFRINGKTYRLHMMKKLLLVLCMILSLAFASCSKDFETYTQEEITELKYESAFQNHFGAIAESHDWGFGSSVATTRSANVNGNLWYQNWQRPINVTEAERQKVIEEFSKEHKNVVNTINVNWNNYWVQQVYQSKQHYNDGFGNDIGEVCSHMNKIIAYNEKGTTTTIYPDWNQWQPTRVTEHYEHVNNFNNGTNTTEYTDDVTGQKYYGTTLMLDMGSTPEGTPKFGYHNTTDSKDHFEYIILEIDGAYYVGFDFCASHPEGQEANKNMDVERDWVFNDWIVKISPAKLAITYDKRIICEDLGAIGDWDFNDVVFDAVFKDGKTYIKLLAAGGTLELRIAGKEVHELFGVSTTTMVNTNNGTVTKDPVEFSVDDTYGYDYAKIPVVVKRKDSAGSFTAYELKYSIGKAPQKIAVGTDYEWCDEKQSIDDKYKRFKDYVGDPNLGYSWYRQ